MSDPFLSGRRISWWSAIFTGVAALVTVLYLREGTPAVGELTERVRYVAEHRAGFIFACLVRVVAAGLVLAFLVTLSRALTPGHPVLRSVATPLVTIGVAAEATALALAAAVLPPLAERLAAGEEEVRASFEVLEGVVVVLSGVVGVGFLSVGGALLGHAAARTPPFPRGLAFLSLPVWGIGLAVAGATLAGSAKSLDLLALLFLPALCLWTGAVAASHFRPPARG